MRFFVALILFTLFASMAYSQSLQEAIDNAPLDSVIILGDGLYEGPITINKTITLKAKGNNAVIKGNGKGSVITVTAHGASVRGLTIMGSGESHEAIDSCVVVRNANNVVVADNTIRDCLFGVNFENSNRGRIENNNIKSKDLSLGLRGDGIRLWYSHSNDIRSNRMDSVRDMVYWYSSANRIEHNHITNSRYSVHFMYADRNFVTSNTFEKNSVGIFLMYSHGSRVDNNVVSSAIGAFGIGIGFKEVSDCIIENNILMYNARGFYIDQSPYQPGTVNKFTGNKILYNTTGVQLHGTILPSIFEDNMFSGNIDSISNDTPGSKLDINKWYRNYWDEYEGFDLNKDGFGDTPYENMAYADKIMQRVPDLKFFYGSPVMSLLNFLMKLLPFSDPELLATDTMPRLKAGGEEVEQ
ncbi:MAG: nitrous oxide reductase family maturation protein NosD [Deferribacterales bacterium]|nr:nitrous oxide reductase family maturation protein NosD [Deferribacterales bacterium]